jgi:hypothetical protein
VPKIFNFSLSINTQSVGLPGRVVGPSQKVITESEIMLFEAVSYLLSIGVDESEALQACPRTM